MTTLLYAESGTNVLTTPRYLRGSERRSSPTSTGSNQSLKPKLTSEYLTITLQRLTNMSLNKYNVTPKTLPSPDISNPNNQIKSNSNNQIKSKLMTIYNIHLLSAAAMLSNSSTFVDTNCFIPSDCESSFLRSWMLSSERDRDKLATLLMVFATSKAKMEISLPSEAMPVKNPPFVCIFDTLFPKVFKKSTAFRAPPSAFVGATYSKTEQQ